MQKNNDAKKPLTSDCNRLRFFGSKVVKVRSVLGNFALDVESA